MRARARAHPRRTACGGRVFLRPPMVGVLGRGVAAAGPPLHYEPSRATRSRASALHTTTRAGTPGAVAARGFSRSLFDAGGQRVLRNGPDQVPDARAGARWCVKTTSGECRHQRRVYRSVLRIVRTSP
jgi:hypothetical protein